MAQLELKLFEKKNGPVTTRPIALESIKLPDAVDLNGGRGIRSVLEGLGYAVTEREYATNDKKFVRKKGNCHSDYTNELRSRGLRICYGDVEFWPTHLRICICASERREKEAYIIAGGLEGQIIIQARECMERGQAEREYILKEMPILQASYLQVAQS
jgi:hypothetical protein